MPHECKLSKTHSEEQRKEKKLNMNKLFTKIATAFAGMAMAVGVGVAVSANQDVMPAHAALTASDISSTPASSVEDGAKYVIASGTSGNVYLAAKASNTWGTAVAIGSAYEFTAEGSGTTGFALKCKDGYLTPKTSSSNTFLAYGSTKVTCNLSSGEIVSNANTTYKLRQNGTSGYRWYSSNTGTAAKLYKINAETPVTGVSVAPTSVTLGVGATQQLTPTITPSNATNKNVTYSSSANSIATVNTSGIITAVAAGSATITVTTKDGNKTATCAVTVTAPISVTGVSLNKPSTTIEAGETETLTATVTPANASNKSVTWTTSDSDVATVAEGVVTAKGAGTATITATTVDGGFTATCSVRVTAPASVTFIAGTDTGSATGQYDSGTLTKSGISFYCSGWKNDSGNYRLYSGKTITFTSTIGNMAKIEFTGTESSYKISNMGSETTGTLVTDADNNKSTWTGSATTVSFEMTAQGRASQVVVTMESTDPSVELDASSATSVSMFKGDTETSVKVLVKNIETKTWSFTFDEDAQEGITTSSYINVSAGAAVSDVHTLNITTKAVGSTTLHISVSGTACETAVPVTVTAKPASMTIVHGEIHEGELEIITGEPKQVSFSGLDTDGNPYSIAAADVTPSATSGASYVTLSGSRITGASQGTAVVRYTLNVLTSVYAEVTVNVVDDYIETVGEPTFATGLTDTQGQSPTVSVFTARPGTMHSGSSTTIPFENYKFSYDSTYASAEYGDVFSYDFSHGTTVDSTHKLQTIYVFCDIDEAAHGSYTVTVEQFNDPLTAITFTNVTNNQVDVSRGSTFQLEWAYTPTNPTDGKEVEFIIDDNSEGIDITVSELGLISIGASSDLGTALVLIQSTHKDTIQDYVYVTATLESMKYTVSETESLTPSSTVSSGDRVYMVVSNGTTNYEFSGLSDTSTIYGLGTEYSTDIAKLQLLTVEDGSSSGTVAFKMSDGNYLNWSSGNSLTSNSTKSNNTSWTVDGSTITNAADTTRQLWWNNGSPRFACYTGKEGTSGYYCPTFVKVTGGDVEYDVSEALFNGVHNNFGTGKTYEWDATCSVFDENAWLNACVALTEITSYSSYKLNRAVANESGNEIEVFLAKYDVIVRKFGETHDHLDRFAVGGINHGTITKVNPLNTISNNGTEVAIIVVTSMIGLSAVGGYFFIRKRKENI